MCEIQRLQSLCQVLMRLKSTESWVDRVHTHKHTCIQAEAHADIHTYIKIDRGTNTNTHIYTQIDTLT